MIQHILYPTDFSPLSLNKVSVAKELTAKTGAKLHILHAYKLPLIDPYATPDMITGVLDASRQKAQREMSEFLDQAGIINAKQVLLSASVIEAVEAYCEELPIDLIILATHGKDQWTEIFTGTFSERIVTHTKPAALILPEYAPSPDFTEITYACDLKGDSIKAISHLDQVCKSFGHVNLSVIHVSGETEENADANVVYLLNSTFNSPPIELIAGNVDPAEAIIQWQKSGKGKGILAVSSHKKGFFERAFHAGVASKLVEESLMPVLVLHEARG
ncbi:MAG: universal stress protein [Bacteroidia bacterium]|nr:universal stress protein [Bacteroidia bacterium]